MPELIHPVKTICSRLSLALACLVLVPLSFASSDEGEGQWVNFASFIIPEGQYETFRDIMDGEIESAWSETLAGHLEDGESFTSALDLTIDSLGVPDFITRLDEDIDWGGESPNFTDAWLDGEYTVAENNESFSLSDFWEPSPWDCVDYSNNAHDMILPCSIPGAMKVGDRDNDGVPDVFDGCPVTPVDPETDEAGPIPGCPDYTTVEVDWNEFVKDVCYVVTAVGAVGMATPAVGPSTAIAVIGLTCTHLATKYEALEDEDD